MKYKKAFELAKKNKEEGYNFLYQSTYQDKLYIALKYIKNEDDAMDVLQDSYMKAFSKLDTLTDAERFPAWLGMIVANTAKNALKRKNPVLFSDMASENEDGDLFEYQIEDEDVSVQPELAFSENETKELVQEMISSLSQEQKMCVLMFHIEGISIKEIAQTLDCSENTVKSRLNYGRKNLKAKAEELQKKGYKLYSISPVSLLLLLLKKDKGYSAIKAIPPFSELMSNASVKTTFGNSAVKAISKAGKKAGFFSTVAGKAVAVGLSLAIVGGSVAAVIANNTKNNDNSIDNKNSTSISQKAQESTKAEDDIVNTIDAVFDAYQKYIDKTDYDGYFTYELGYVDDDDIPELFIVLKDPPASRANINRVLSYNGRKVQEKQEQI